MTDTVLAPPASPRVRSSDPLYWEVREWLDDESAMLDAGHTMEWTQLLAKDLLYRLPVRQNRLRDDPESQFASGMFHYDENHTTLVMKVMRLATTASPWAENPMSRTRRFVTNVRVHRTAVDDELEISSSLLVSRSRYTEPHPLILTAERQDLLRRTGEGTFLLVRRTILVDQATLGYPNLAVFF
ncbi:MAG: 3-phenylpropionate/cinnamic acid dioxygenase subunit beta [Frankiales bacterium]|nr:3-phenylpropionate/cinnamic acid dioxygenase subunit beta [Frankiales bacterium]